jgi:hypothetical protein
MNKLQVTSELIGKYINQVLYTDVNPVGNKYRMVFKTENISKVLPGSYEVKISSKGIAHFKHKSVGLQYWISTEAGSKFEKGE